MGDQEGIAGDREGTLTRSHTRTAGLLGPDSQKLVLVWFVEPQ